MSNAESSLRLRVQADIAALKEYQQALLDVKRTIVDVQGVVSGPGGAPMTPGAGPSTGAPPPHPSTVPSHRPPPPRGTAEDGAPPPHPTTPSPVAPSGPSGGAPPPPPPPPAGGGSAPPAPYGPSGTVVHTKTQRELDILEERERRLREDLEYRRERARVQDELREQREARRPSMLRRGINSAGGWLGTATATATGVALGGSIQGFILGSAEKFMQVDTILTKLRRTLRGTGDDAVYLAGQMGFTAEQSVRIAEQLTAATNTYSRSEALRSMGFARMFGLDAGSTAHTVGTLGHLAGGELSDRQLLSLQGIAAGLNMGRGRFGEFLQTTAGLAESQFDATGQLDFGRLRAVSALPGMVFGGNDPRAQGQRGAAFTQGLHGMLTSDGAMQVHLMRAIGYGTDPNLDYITMRKRLAAGIHDPENLRALMGSFDAMGLSREMKFFALESVAGGQLAPHQIEALIDGMSTPEQLAAFTGAQSDVAEGAQSRRGLREAGLTKRQAGRFREGGLAGAGSSFVGRGEWRAVQTEAMQLRVGDVASQMILDLQKTVFNLVESLANLAEVDIGTFLTDTTGYLKDISENMKRASERGGWLHEKVDTVREGATLMLGQGDPQQQQQFNEWWRNTRNKTWSESGAMRSGIDAATQGWLQSQMGGGK